MSQVFCSAWDRANHSYCPQNPKGGSWGCGACADAARGVGDGCYVGAWSTEDLHTWTGPVKALTLPLPQTVPNVGASMVPSTLHSNLSNNLPAHQAFMALENGELPLAINVGSDRNLSMNWQLLSVNVTDKHGRCNTPYASALGTGCLFWQ